MADYKKTVKGLECCVLGAYGCQVGCPYAKEDKCQISLKQDALDLLKDYQSRMGKLGEHIRNARFRCGEIDSILLKMKKDGEQDEII